MKNTTILFLHGFFASGQCTPAIALKEAFEGRCYVFTPDLPLHPEDVLRLVRNICDREHPDVLVGNSCGSFYAQIVANEKGIPAVLGNPYFLMTEFLEPRIGQHQYKSPRKDGNQHFTIDESLIQEFAELQKTQFDSINLEMKDRIWGLFGENDTLAHFEPVFREHYSNVHHFPGAHTPTAEEVKQYYTPLIEQLILAGKSQPKIIREDKLNELI